MTYIGIDHMPAFIQQARQAYAGSARTAFFECDFATATWPVVDYVIASGALSYRSANPRFHLDMICKMYESARRAVIFNMLDATVFPEHPLLVGQNRDEIVKFCHGQSPRVQVISGYQKDGFSVCMHQHLTVFETGDTRGRLPSKKEISQF